MIHTNRLILIVGTLFLLGCLYWPIMLIAFILLSYFYPPGGIMLGIFLDILYGSPDWYIAIPYTIGALLLSGILYLGKKLTTAGEWRIKVKR